MATKDLSAQGSGQQKFNPHQLQQKFEPKAKHPTSGCAELSLITRTSLAQEAADLKGFDLLPPHFLCDIEIKPIQLIVLL